MTARSLLKIAEKYAADNAPTLISGVAVTGSLASVFLTGRATFKAAKIIEAEERRRTFEVIDFDEGDSITVKEAFPLVWKCYVPPALVLAGTVACIVTANSMSASRLAGMAAAYKLSEKQFKEYEDKVRDKLGLQDEKRMRDEINEERVRRNPPSDDVQILATEDEVVFLEKWTGRYFRSKMHIVKAAENQINRSLIHDTYATLSDFYDEIGLANTQESSEVGWSLENPIALDFTSTLADGNTRPVIVMEYANRPSVIKEYTSRYAGRSRDPEGYPGFH
jgi:hypothetical protein